jgi:DNA polymerase III alpha subunit/nucleotidyltransferase/DNA polymerase involved in DNA repair
MRRTILHLDADAFFASVEQATDPFLRGKPIAVGGEKRGVVASASYEARKFGIYTPMPTARARKLCPKLILVPGDFEKYERFSHWMFSYAYDFTPEVEFSSIDEGYFDLSSARKPPSGIAEKLRSAIQGSLNITISEGVGSNKLISQIASKLSKPASYREVPLGQEQPFLRPLPSRWLPGVGPKTAARLHAAGLAEIGQIAATPLDLLWLLLGNMGESLKQFAEGRDDRPIGPADAPAKSYSQQETFAADTTDEEYLVAVLQRMADQLMAKVREDGKSIRTLTVKVRYNDMAEDQCSESLLEPTDLETDVYSRLKPMLRQAWKRRVSLRLVSLKFANVYEGFQRLELPLERAARQQDARCRLALAVDELRRTHGAGAILRGHDFLLAAYEFKAKGACLGPASIRRLGNIQGRVVPPPHGDGERESPDPRGTMATSRNPARGGADKIYSQVRARRRTFVPLQVRSYYSFLNSTLSVQALVDLAQRYELPAIALSDQGNLHGAVEFVQAARAAGIKPIVGAEIYVAEEPVRLYVENTTGYRNLCRILSASTARVGANRVPQNGTEDEESAKENKTSDGRPRTARPGFLADLSKDDTAGLLAVATTPKLAPFFPERFYLEASSPEAFTRRHDPQRPGRDTHRLPFVASLPVHYGTLEDRWKYDVVQSIRTLTLLRQEHPEKRLTGDFHFRTPLEMNELFGQYPDLLQNSVEIAERCSFEFPFGKPQFPPFDPPDGSTPHLFLRKLVLAGLRERYGKRSNQIQPKVEEELRIINEVGYAEYFLVVWGILQECRRRGIDWITRGSAADSLVCYCLRISDACPIRFDLYFRRFLNRDRMQLNKLPDIDLDFAHDRKDDVIDLIFEKYGAERTAAVGGFSTYQARGAVGDVAKVLGVSEHQIRRFTEHFPWTGARGVEEALRQSQECRDLPLDEDPYRTALRMAEFLDGFPRYAKMHPCGVVLSRQPLLELTPTFISNKGFPTTHYDMDAVEAIGLVKMDILAQGGLAVMRDVQRVPEICRRLAEATAPPDSDGDLLSDHSVGGSSRRQEALDLCTPPVILLEDRTKWGGTPLAEIGTSLPRLRPPTALPSADVLKPWKDPEVWEMIANGGARAVHHIESPAMIGLCRMCNVRDIDGLIAIVSVIRPGAANEQKKVRFTRRYQELEPVAYPHPSLESCLKNTYGMVVYEEHILQICEAFAGLPPGRADVLRRALAKYKQSVIEEIRGEFFVSARAWGHTEEKIAEVWELVTGFSGYAFCKAHSTAYGVEAYQSAWLKRYFPAEFMAGVLSNGKGFYHPLVYVLECHRLGIPLLAPWVNEPGPAFTVTENRAIRVPATRVKGLTQRTRERMVTERAKGEFQSLRDVYCRVGPLAEEMEALLRVGAFDLFGKARTAQFWEAQFLARAFGHDAGSRQGWLFPPPRIDCLPEMSLREPSRRQRLEWETELLDFTASGHPLELFDSVAWETYCPVARLGEHVNEEVVTCGLVIEQRLHHQVTGEAMKFLTLADWTGIVETELFASTYRSYGLATVRYPVLEIAATVEPFENQRGFSLRVHRAGKPRTRKASENSTKVLHPLSL